MKNDIQLRDKKQPAGFTLVEILAVLVLLGILAAFAVPKYVSLQSSASQRVIDAAVAELNGREQSIWGQIKITTTHDSDSALDSAVVAAMDTDLGTDYSWSNGPNAAGGTIEFNGETKVLVRTSATLTAPATWGE